MNNIVNVMAARPPMQVPGGSSPYLGGAPVGPDFQVAPPPQYMSPRPGMMVCYDFISVD